MEKTAPPDSLIVRGDALKRAREARDMSVHEMAGAITLSREQVRALEEGGNLPFYTAAHKRLALKKYAGALGIPLSDLIADTTPSDTATGEAVTVESSTAALASDTPTGLRLAAVERTARYRRHLLVAAVVAAVMLATYAKQRGTPNGELPSAPVEMSSAPIDSPATTPLHNDVAALPASRPDASAPEPVDAQAVAATTATGSCALPPAVDALAWSPPYQRKADARLFLISSKTAEVCIADASGKSSVVLLKPGAGQSFAGKPPYLVRAEALASIEIYLQGMRVRTPSDTQLMLLVPTRVTRATEVAASQPPD